MLITQLLKVSASFRLIYQCDSSPNFRKYPYIFIAAATMVGKRMPISSFSHVTLQKILQRFWVHNSVFICPKTSYMILYRLYQNYGKIDHNLCDYYQLTDVLFISWTQHILWRQLIPGDYLSEMVSGEEVQHYFKRKWSVREKFPIFTLKCKKKCKECSWPFLTSFLVPNIHCISIQRNVNGIKIGSLSLHFWWNFGKRGKICDMTRFTC